MSIQIHPTTLVAKEAQLSDGVSIGPYCLIGPDVVIKENVKLHSHVVVEGHTTIGAGTEVFPFATLGLVPQSIHYMGEASTLEIGEKCILREHVTIHRGTANGRMKTIVGNNCYIMIGSHIGHDCIIGNNVIMANNATLGGEVTVGDFVNIGGLAAIHQFVRIGAHAMISGTAGVNEDVIPFGMIMAKRSALEGLNLIGMKRRGFDRAEIHALRHAFKLLSRKYPGTLESKIAQIRETLGEAQTVKELLIFISEDPERRLSLPDEEWELEVGKAEESARAGSA
ncbi:MAG: acyl-ACP--UDP-N-acetylglucosamine O-acyltransferase [Alphaproteobacteria bacterium]|nr:acyl-ACP--UDP-N-acetylglucosamine O-acyltransferase [Alphaproteobacteria bacterium]